MRLKNTYICISVLSLLLFLASGNAHAQDKKGNRILTEMTDTIPLFRGIAVSVDAVGPMQRLLSSYGQYEAALRVNLKDRFFPIVELGWGDANNTNDLTGITYKTKAPYGRIGCDLNVAKNKHDDYRIYAGIRYAFTSFKYDVSSVGVTDPIWKKEVVYEGYGNSCSYHWLEGCLGIDAKIVGPLRLGWTARYRGRIAQKHGDLGEPWYVPGFGKRGESRLAATFNIIFEL